MPRGGKSQESLTIPIGKACVCGGQYKRPQPLKRELVRGASYSSALVCAEQREL